MRWQKLRCRLRLHRWRYFIDGRVCRVCPPCHAVQYDLPMYTGRSS